MANAPGRRPVWNEEQLEQAVALKARGWSVLRIADEIGLTRSTTRRLLVRTGQVSGYSDDTNERRRELLVTLVRHLRKGMALAAAADTLTLDLQYARALIRDAAGLIPEPLSAGLQRQAADVRRHLKHGDVHHAARALGIDPWLALFLLTATGEGPLSMQPQIHDRTRARAALMAERRAAGATFEQIGAEFGLGRERVRRLLLATGGWTPPKR